MGITEWAETFARLPLSAIASLVILLIFVIVFVVFETYRSYFLEKLKKDRFSKNVMPLEVLTEYVSSNKQQVRLDILPDEFATEYKFSWNARKILLNKEIAYENYFYSHALIIFLIYLINYKAKPYADRLFYKINILLSATSIIILILGVVNLNIILIYSGFLLQVILFALNVLTSVILKSKWMRKNWQSELSDLNDNELKKVNQFYYWRYLIVVIFSSIYSLSEWIRFFNPISLGKLFSTIKTSG